MLVTQLCDPMDCSPQAPLPMGFAKQEYWSELPFSSPGDLPNLGIEPRSPALAGRFFTTEPPGKSMSYMKNYKFVLEICIICIKICIINIFTLLLL